MLIVFAGLPGTGKSSLASELARRLDAAYLRIDSIEQALANSSLGIRPAADAGYMAGYALAEDNLRIGRTVVADSVNPLHVTRNAWLAVAERAGREAVEVEVVCTDPIEHRRRIETRSSDVPGLPLPTWRDVLGREYHTWDRDRIVVDTAGRSVEQCADELVAHVSPFRRRGDPTALGTHC